MNFSNPNSVIEIQMAGVGHVEQADEKVSPVEDSTTQEPNAQGTESTTEEKD